MRHRKRQRGEPGASHYLAHSFMIAGACLCMLWCEQTRLVDPGLVVDGIPLGTMKKEELMLLCHRLHLRSGGTVPALVARVRIISTSSAS